MSNPMKEQNRAREAYQKWWRSNRDTLNNARRERYHQDEEYRRKMAERQARYRATLPPPVKDGRKFRVVRGEKLQVFSISRAAEAIGRSPITMRVWQKKGWIPKPTMGGRARFYSAAQVQLMSEFVALLNTMAPSQTAHHPLVLAKVAEMAKHWDRT